MNKNKPEYASVNTTAKNGYRVDLIPCEINGITYTIPEPVASYIEALQVDRDNFVTFRQMSADEMSAFVNSRARAIVDVLNGNLPRYNLEGRVFLAKKIDASDFETMDSLCALLEKVIFDTARKAPGTDPNADGLIKEI